ncbi:hypothetical protein AB0I81_03540 [Nonomuraea sp. NPDC050404]|uniref:hypothetical protein n=1 Tax=Nonomuraea sp. NPDC050404 TaxID=3155783 RepID=UPI0033F2BC82
MRFIVDMEYAPDGIHGLVTREGCDCAVPFHGWLELLRELEGPYSRGNPWDGP